MRAKRIIFTDPKFCCEECRSNGLEIQEQGGYYEVAGCPICGGHVNGISDENHVWKVHESINQFLRDHYDD